MTRLYGVHIACNDPDNGHFARKAQALQLDFGKGDYLELGMCGRRDPGFLVLDGGFFRLGRYKYPFSRSGEWVGNWCWNGYWMPIPEVVRFLDWLHRRRLFHCTTGETRIYNMWNNSAGFDDEDRRFLWRMLGKPSNHHAAA